MAWREKNSLINNLLYVCERFGMAFAYVLACRSRIGRLRVEKEVKMKLKKLFSVGLAAGLFGFGSIGVQAATLDYVGGPIDWKLNGYTTEGGTLYGNESTWGIGNITSLQDANTLNNVWSSGQDGDYLYYMIYGIADLSTTSGGTYGNNIYNIGATGGSGPDGMIHIDIYRTHTLFNFGTATTAGRTAFDAFTGITGGMPYLRLVLVPGGIADDPSTPLVNESTATLFQDVNSTTLPASGQGFFYAEVVGGSAASKWDTNGFLSGAADFNGRFTLTPNMGRQGLNQQFPGYINDPIMSNAISEPMSVALAGLGLVGLAAMRRRKQDM